MSISTKNLTEEQKIITTMSEFKEQMLSKQRHLIITALIVVIVLLLVVGVWIYIKSVKSKAEELEAEGYRYFYSASGENQKANYEKALEAFKKSYETKKTAYALLYIANCYEGLGRLDDAIKSLKELVEQFSDPTMLSLGYNKLAALYTAKGDAQSALEVLDRLKKTKGAKLQDFAYLQAGAILETMGKTDEAKAQYRELSEKFPNSLLAPMAKAKVTAEKKP